MMTLNFVADALVITVYTVSSIYTFKVTKVLPLTIFNKCIWKSLYWAKSMIHYLCDHSCFMFILFYWQVLHKPHTNRWSILKVLPHVVNVSLSRWTPGFSANTVPSPYGEGCCAGNTMFSFIPQQRECLRNWYS